MLEKGILVTLITGFTAVIVTVWITVDFCLYRRKKAAIRAAKADTFYRKPHAERVVQPFQKKKEDKGKKVSSTPKPRRTLSVRQFMNFFKGKKNDGIIDDKDSVIESGNETKESGTKVKKGDSVPISKVEAGGSSKTASVNSDDKRNSSNRLSKDVILEDGASEANVHKNPLLNGAILSKIQSSPNFAGKWTNAVGPSELPAGKKALPPLKGKASSKSIQEGISALAKETINEGIGNVDDAQKSNTDIELNEMKDNKMKSKPPFKQKNSKSKMKTESEVFVSKNEQNDTEQKVNTNDVQKKPPLLKRISRNRVDSINDGSTSSTDTRETFVEERGSSASSSWTCDESGRKRTGSFSDSTTSSGSIELEKRKFRLKPLKRNQSNMSMSDTTPLT
ncbi:uncharacterized protein LOC132544120 [Ylistrum balloti]|uniref:uncharacterized protein LOC132544120 n=1 Tax=Ylistrum balloti TaxID=509963 RepID=UPI002905A775|nr:uncharacterized protein LOC132544120 [Ylistrum balloti]